MKIRSLSLCALVALFGAARASADVVHTFDIGGLSTDAGFFDSFPTLTHDFGVAGTIVLFEFDVTYESFAPSWMSEVAISVDTNDDFSLDADAFMSDYGATNSAGVFSASDSLAANSFSSDGLVFLTLWDTFADTGAVPDATFFAGSFVRVTYRSSVAAVPEPSSLVLCALGSVTCGAIGWRKHRRMRAAA